MSQRLRGPLVGGVVVILALAGVVVGLLVATPGRAEAQAGCEQKTGYRLCPGITYRTIPTSVGQREFKLDAYIPDAPSPLPPGETRPRHAAVVLVHGGGDWNCEGLDVGKMGEIAKHLAGNDLAAFVIHYVPSDNPLPSGSPNCNTANNPPGTSRSRVSSPPSGQPELRTSCSPSSSCGTTRSLTTSSRLASGCSGPRPARISRPTPPCTGKARLKPACGCGPWWGAGGPYTLFANLRATPLQYYVLNARQAIANYLGSPCTPDNVEIGGLCAPYAATASPISYVDSTDPPMMFVHGAQDPIVPKIQVTGSQQYKGMRDELTTRTCHSEKAPGTGSRTATLPTATPAP